MDTKKAVRELLWDEWKKTALAGLTDHRNAEKEARKLFDEHFLDYDNQDFEPHHHIDTTKKNLQGIKNAQHRAVFVLMVSQSFSRIEIARILNLSKRSVDKIYLKIKATI